jgi:hypothetical protein
MKQESRDRGHIVRDKGKRENVKGAGIKCQEKRVHIHLQQKKTRPTVHYGPAYDPIMISVISHRNLRHMS